MFGHFLKCFEPLFAEWKLWQKVLRVKGAPVDQAGLVIFQGRSLLPVQGMDSCSNTTDRPPSNVKVVGGYDRDVDVRMIPEFTKVFCWAEAEAYARATDYCYRTPVNVDARCKS